MSKDFLTEIREYAAETGWSPSYFCRVACGNGEVPARLEAGGSCTMVTAEKIRSFMQQWREEKASAA